MSRKRSDVSEAQKRALAEYLQQARAGNRDFAWLDQIVRQAGYARVAAGDDDRLLATARVLAAQWGVTERQVRRFVREGLPVHRRGVGNMPDTFDVFECYRWYLDRERAEREQSGVDDPLLVGGAGTSQWLEAYRKEKVREAKRRNDVEEAMLLPAADVAAQLSEIGRIFREEIEAFGRVHGAKLARELRGMIDRAEKAWRKTIKKTTEGTE